MSAGSPPGGKVAGVLAGAPGLDEGAARWAARLGLPLLASRPAAGLVLVLRPGAPGGMLALEEAAGRARPLAVDFAAGRQAWRARRGGPELLARAAGLRGGRRPAVLDATAGLGADAWVLAGLGCAVTAVERHPVVAALLEDGLRRAALRPELAERAARVRLLRADAREVLGQEMPEGGGPWPVACLDPMYPTACPAGRGSALPRREMRLLRHLVGEDGDAEALLRAALGRARRVVVKRPRRAPPLAGLEPHHRVEGASTRYDVYLDPFGGGAAPGEG